MKNHWSGVFVALGFATTAVLGAQGNPSPANTPPPDAAAPPGIQRTTPVPAAEAKGNTVTITGCIQDVPMTAAGAAAPAPAAREGATTAYYLNNATMDAARDRGAAVGTSGLSATGYRLEGDSKLITPHLNHQVRIAGMVQSSSASPTGAANASPGSTAAVPTLKIDTVTMLSAKCEAAK
jgi:hypothetical protein